MTDELSTPAAAGIESVQPEQHDTAPEWDFYDPELDGEDTVEVADAEAIEDEGETADAELDTEEADPEHPEGKDDEEKADTGPDLIELPNGSKVERDEVVKGYLRQADYTRKTTEVAEMRKALEADTTRITQITDAFIDQVAQMITPAPDPSLAQRDPSAYTRQKAAHDADVQRLQQIHGMAEQAKQTQSGLSERDKHRLVAEESQKLVAQFPEAATPEGRKAFFARTAEAAQAAGFSMDELQGVTDHRMFALAHWAQIGMKAKEAEGKAREKAAKAPPATPNKPSNPRQRGAARNRDAVRRLEQSGSIHDAVQVDFD